MRYKDEYILDDNDNLIQEIKHSYNYNTGQIMENYNTYYLYDENQMLLLDSSFRWDANLSEWMLNYKKTYQYGSNNNVNSTSRYDWDSENSQWSISTKIDKTYDLNNNLIVDSTCVWNANSNLWESFAKTENEYDLNNNLLIRADYDWDSTTNEWLYARGTEHTYDADGNEIEQIAIEWDSDNNQSSSSNKQEFSYNLDHLISETIFTEAFEDQYAFVNIPVHSQNYFLAVDAWEPRSIIDFYYSGIPGDEIVDIPDVNFLAAIISNDPVIDVNTDGQIQVSEAEAYTGVISVPSQNISNLIGIEAFVNITGIDCSDNQIEILDLSHNMALESIVCNDNQLIFLNVANGSNNSTRSLNATNIANENFLAQNNPDLYCIKVDDPAWSSGNWTNIDAQSYFTDDCSTSISETSISNFKLFPNPCIGQLQIEGKNINKVEIYTAKGTLVKSIDSNQENISIDLSEQSKGIFFVKVITHSGTLSQKLILE